MQGARFKVQGARFMLSASLASVAFLAGCRQDMHDQPKMFPQRSTPVFADGRSSRPQVENTVGRGQLHDDSYFYTGIENGQEGAGLPFPVTPAVLERGQERYNVYCTPCHSRVGNGVGKIVERGYRLAGNFHTERLRAAGLGHFFNVITNGYGAMPDYAAQIAPEDRWAIAAYIRALQLSQNAKSSDVPAGVQVKPVADVAKEMGLTEDFANDWVAPSPSAPAAPAVPKPADSATPTPEAKPAVAPATSENQKSPSPTAKSTPAPATEKTVAKVEAPAAPSAADVAAGHAVYTANCQMCHQAARTGMPPMIPSLVGIVGRVGPGHIRSVVTTGIPTGKPAMPSFKDKLSSKDIDQLIAFLGSAK